MSTDHHTPYSDGATQFEDSDMNAPLGELDSAIGDFTGGKGQIARVNEGESSLEFFDSSYDVGGAYNGSPTASLVLMRFPFVRTVQFTAGMSLSKFVAGVAATGSTVFSIRKNGVEFATATFGAGAQAATFSCPVNTVFAPGNTLTIVAPGSPDATLANLGWCLAGTRNVHAVTTTTTTTTSSTTTTS
jgi:hypothetical protein